MARERVVVFGRDEQWARLDETVAARSGSGAVMMIRGRAGAGKTALLDAVTHGWQRQGMEVISVETGHAPDLYTVDAFIDALRRRLERGTDSELLEAVAAAVARRQQITDDPRRNLLPTVHEVSRAVAEISRRRRTVVVVEDVHRADPLLAAALPPLVQRIRAAGCVVVVSTRPESAPQHLNDLADETIDLEPLTDDAVSTLLARWGAAGGRTALDPTLVAALRTALGSLYGNPGTVLSTVRTLHERERLVVADEHFCLSPSTQPIGLPDDHELVGAVRGLGDGAERLASLLAALELPVTVDDLPVLTAAAAVGLEASGRVVDTLVARGVLEVDDHDRLRFAVPALAVTLGARVGAASLRALHGALARRLLAHLDRGIGVDTARLADHLVHAEPNVGGVSAINILIEEAERVVVSDPARAANRYQVAVRSLPPSDSRWSYVLGELLQLRMSLGQYRDLADDLGNAAPALLSAADAHDGRECPALLIKVGMCWLSAVMHEEWATDIRMATRMLGALGGLSGLDTALRKFFSAVLDGRVREGIGLINSLFEHLPEHMTLHGSFLIGPDDVLMALNALDATDDDFRRVWTRWQGAAQRDIDPEALREAGSLIDFATVLELILGDHYGRPSSGNLVNYQQVVRAYHAGEWDAALSLARVIETDRPKSKSAPVQRLARVFAAEICSERGDHSRAAQWMDGVPQAMLGGHLVSWVRCGMLHRTGRTAEALTSGWQDYLRHRAQGALAGLERLLARLIDYAVQAQEHELAEQMLVELEELDADVHSRSSGEALLLMRGLLRRDLESVQAGLGLTRRRGDLPQVARGCLLIADLSAEPRTWLHESYALAKRFGSTRGRGQLHDVMRERGIAPPRSRSRQTLFTATETRIIGLVSDGLTNRQIAMSIQVSEKTVESHLTRLFARTGCRSRVELAAAQLEGRLLAEATN